MSFAKTVMIAICSAACTFGSAAVNSAIAADPVHEGAKAPDFTLPDQNGQPVKLSDFQGKRIILFFYDLDNEPFSDKDRKARLADIKKYKLEGTDLLCIGTDPLASHKKMSAHGKFNLNYHLLTDKNDSVRTGVYGLPHPIKGRHNNYAIVVDKDATIRKLVDGTKTRNKEESMGKVLRYLGDFGVSAY
jgi:peroxiredoxin